MENKQPEQVVILCGGLGTRLRDYADPVPKALVPIGGYPILYHIMKTYAHYGFKEFILCLGYKQDEIKRYFLNHEMLTKNFTLDLKSKDNSITTHGAEPEDWKITFVNTGKDTLTGGRIKRIEKYIKGDTFLATYADGLSTVNVQQLLDFHKKHGKVATLTGVQPESPFGILECEGDMVSSFREKPKMEGFINGGFFVFNKKIFDYLDEECILEREPLVNLAKDRQLAVFKHTGFWTCMDTPKDVERLNKMHADKDTPWKVWD